MKKKGFNKKLSRQIDLTHYGIDHLAGLPRTPVRVRRLKALRARLNLLEKRI